MSESTYNRPGAEDAETLLSCCLRGLPWPAAALRRLIDQADTPEGSRALFGTLAEGLSDRFEPALTEAYAALFSEVIASALPGYSGAELLARYQRVRQPRRFAGDAGDVYVLSRVTLGADVAVTSVVLDAAKRRFPNARIILVGGPKSHELFAADPRIGRLPAAYGRCGTLRERIAACPDLWRTSGIVIDPDSRLTQLGLLPVCPEENYYLFESRAYGGDGDESLTALARRWVAQTFGIAGARPYLAPGGPPPASQGCVTVSLGVGENPAKRVADPFEQRLLQELIDRGLNLIVDTGAGGEEAGRVERALGACTCAREGQVRPFQGSFAAFAGAIAQARLYIGYDSAGQHVAAACGVPLVTVFAGFPSDRFLARWHPTGSGPITVIRAEPPDPERMLARTLEAIDRLL